MCATYVRVCLTSLPGVAPGDRAFADVGPKVLIRYYYHSYGTQFLCWRLSLAEALPTRGEGGPSVLRAYKTPIVATAQKLTHSPAHEEKHAGQETPLHYTH